jgi:hypothetical protein
LRLECQMVPFHKQVVLLAALQGIEWNGMVLKFVLKFLAVQRVSKRNYSLQETVRFL